MKWSMAADFSVHDLAADGCEMLGGSFMPAGPQVQFEIDAAYSFLGNSRGALLLYVGHPDVAEDRVFDAGGKPTEGTKWFSVGSIGGESPWASTTHRRLSVDIDPSKRVTWQVLAAIIGGAEKTPVVQAPRDIVITPDGVKAFVNSTTTPAITPISLGRPGFSYRRDLFGTDAPYQPISTNLPATCMAAGNELVVVGMPGSVGVYAVLTHEEVGQVELADSTPTAIAIAADESFAVAVTEEGRVVRIDLPACDGYVVDAGARLTGVAIALDGTAAYLSQDGGRVARVRIPRFEVEATIDLEASPLRLRVAPDGKVWALCRPAEGNGRLASLHPADVSVRADYELPFPDPLDFAIVPTADQGSSAVRTAWVVYDKSRYSQFNIGGAFPGTVHSIHHGAFGDSPNDATGVAVNDYGEIWVVQQGLDQVFKWIGGRLRCRASRKGMNEVFFGEYLEVTVHGAQE